MKNHCRYAVVVAIVCLFGTIASTNAQSTTFTYQGRLNNGADPADGNYDLTFTLFGTSSGAGQIGDTITNTSLPVSNGLFTVTLDFGTNFSGANRWLEIGVRSNGVGAFDTLTPRQLITATPYAITAGNLTGSLPASQLTGALSSAQLSGTYVGTVNFSSPANNFGGNGGNLTNVNAALLGGFSAASFWKLPGNAGTTAGIHFLGTTDNQPLELKVNNQRGLRIEPGSVPNFIAGSSNNFATGAGVAISGGDSNRVLDTSSFGTIGGGNQNLIDGFSEGSTIGGGQNNGIFNSYRATIGGGIGNSMPGEADRGVIGGGTSNKINHSIEGTIGGGKRNEIRGGRYSAISGGFSNQLEHVAHGSIGGGWSNSIFSGADNSTIAGGSQNLIDNALNATISGGNLNTIFGTNSTIAGGFSNTVNALNSTIGGGVKNRIYGVVPEGAEFNTISGGSSNSIQGIVIPKAYANSIGGGTENTIGPRATHNTIGGGADNLIFSDSKRSTIGGGGLNVLDGDDGTIAGGFANQIIAYTFNACSIGGGRSNLIGGCNDATIGGGRANHIGGMTDYSTISGGASNRITGSTRYATIPGGLQARATHFGQLAYASGQFASAGDAQTSIHVCRGITTNSTPTELFLDGALRRMDMLENSTWIYDILVTGRTTAGDSAGYQIRGVIENNAGNTALVGTPDLTVLTEDVPAWNAAVTVGGNLTNALVIQVTGAAATTIRWVASVRTVEVTH